MEITQERVNEVLRSVGASMLKKKYQSEWCEENPTFGYCYIVAEAVYHYIKASDVRSYCISLGCGDTHWFIEADGKRLDFTADQFFYENIPIPYEKAKRVGFFKGTYKTDRGYISKRAFEIAKLLGLTA